MNIFIICHYGLYQDFTFSFVHNQAKAYVAAGHRVRVLIPIPVGKADRGGNRMGKLLTRTRVDGVELYGLRYVSLSNYGERRFNTASAITAIRMQYGDIFRDFCPDVIHAHTLGFDSDIGAWLKEKLGAPLVVTTHGSDTEKPLKQGRGERLRIACDRADQIVAVSTCLGERLRTCGTQTPIITILNGFLPNKAEGTLSKDPYSILQVGHLIPSKRNAVTIQALALLRKKYPHMTLKIIGAGVLRKELEELVDSLGLTDAVKFTGEIPNPQVLSAMAGATYFVMASKPEGFGIVYLEAMNNYCVTIGTEGEGIADLIQSGNNGFLVPVDNPEAIASVIEKCILDPQRAGAIAQRGHADVAGLTWDQNALQYISLFTHLREKADFDR